MAFDITPPSRNLSNVQATSKTTDGGAGNTGYFMRGKKEDEEINFKFLHENEKDLFIKSSNLENKEEDTGFLILFIRFILNLFKKIKQYLKNSK